MSCRTFVLHHGALLVQRVRVLRPAAALDYDALGLIGTTFRELGWKTRIFFERAGPIAFQTVRFKGKDLITCALSYNPHTTLHINKNREA